MTTIILVSIGILLAAIAALFVIFFGGNAFHQGADKAAASTLINAGLNVESAVQGYYNRNAAMPNQFSDLMKSGDDQWIGRMPALATAAAGTSEIATIDGTRYYVVRKVANEATCIAVNAGYGNVSTTVPTSIGKVKRGCYSNSGEYTYFLNLESGDGSTAAAEPLMFASQRKAADEGDDDKAAYLRKTGAYVRAVMARTAQYPSSLEALGIPKGTFDYGGISNNQIRFMQTGDGKRFYVVGIAGSGICRAAHSQSGHQDYDGWMGRNKMGEYAEGCGADYGQDDYWIRVDDVQNQSQVAAFLANAKAGYAAVSALGERPLSYGQLGSLPELYGLMNPQGATGMQYDPVYLEYIVPDAIVCRAINVAGGGRGDVGPWAGDTRDGRTFGCYGSYGEQRAYYRIDDAYTPKQMVEIEQFGSFVRKAVADAGGDTEDGRANARKAFAEWKKPYGGDIGLARDPAGRLVMYMRIEGRSVCQRLADKYGIGRTDYYANVDYNYESGCNGSYGTLYYWTHVG